MTLVPLEAIYTSNDTYTELPPAGADGFSSATITVDVPSSSPFPITIDRVSIGTNTYYLSDFTEINQVVELSIPSGSSVIHVSTDFIQLYNVWNVSLTSNTAAGSIVTTFVGGYYFMYQSSNAPELKDSNGETYFLLIDNRTSDGYPGTFYVPWSKFNFDFTTVPN